MMDRETDRAPQTENTAEWGLRNAKLAVAVAVIKSRPPGKSSRQHAEHLAIKLRSEDHAWKTKAQGLQEEVLRLRQELQLTKTLLKPRNTTKAETRGDGFMLSQDLMGSLNSDMDSGCGTENNTETLLPIQDSAGTSAQPALPPITTTAAQFPFSTLCEGGPWGKTMLFHMQFLQSLCGLGRVEGEGGLEDQGLSLGRDRSVVADSVCQLLSCVVAACKDARPLPPHILLLQASRVAAQAVDHLRSSRLPSVSFMTHVEDSLKELTGVLLHNDQLKRVQVQEKVTECLIHLGGSSLLKSFLIHHVLSEINRLADHFWHTCQGGSERSNQFEVALYENSFYLFWVLEQLLQGGQGPGEAGETGHHCPPEQRALLRHLERSVLLLSDEFPLFALYMWRIGALLSPSDITQT